MLITYTLPLITKIFEQQYMKYSSNKFYNITRAETIAFNALRNEVVLSNLRKLYYYTVSTIMKNEKQIKAFYRKSWKLGDCM